MISQRLPLGLRNRIGAIVLLLLAVWYLSQAAGMQLWRGAVPGPGFMPIVMGTTLMILSCIMLTRTQQDAQLDGPSKPAEPRRVALPWVVVIVLAIYVIALPIIGYIISSTALMLFLFRAYRPHHWRTDLGVSITTGIVLYSVFKLLLNVNLPDGTLMELLRF